MSASSLMTWAWQRKPWGPDITGVREGKYNADVGGGQEAGLDHGRDICRRTGAGESDKVRSS